MKRLRYVERATDWRRARLCLPLAVLCLLFAASPARPQQQEKQDIPDAPSATRPPQPLPAPPPPPATGNTPENQPGAASEPAGEEPPPKPPLNIKTVPEGGATVQQTENQDLYKIVANVNQVIVPVMVKDDSDHMVNGLLAKDFAVYENGVRQKMNFFTSDPFALSVAVVLDLGMSDAAVQKVNQTFPALEGAFSQFDEVSIYTYSSSVSKAADFGVVGNRLTAVLNDLKTVHGQNNGPPVMTGPISPQGPMINGRSVDPSAPVVYTPPKESRVLNDAILAAALDLRSRERTRRKIIFVISDGREYRSNASYSDVLKVLLSSGVMVYGVGVEGASIPLYGKLQKMHLPRFGTGDILPKYASATGGEIFTEFSRDSIGSVYARAIGEARNQYTLGYLTRATPSSSYKEIEVKVNRPDCADFGPPCVRTTARAGYYPLPPGR